MIVRIKKYIRRNVRKRTFRHIRPDSDQPVHLLGLVGIFIVRISNSHGCKVSPCGQRKLLSDCAHAHPDLSLRWAHVRRYVFSRCGSYDEQQSKRTYILYGNNEGPDQLTRPRSLIRAFSVHQSLMEK